MHAHQSFHASSRVLSTTHQWATRAGCGLLVALLTWPLATQAQDAPSSEAAPQPASAAAASAQTAAPTQQTEEPAPSAAPDPVQAQLDALQQRMDVQQALIDKQRARIEELESRPVQGEGEGASDAELAAFLEGAGDADVSEYEKPDVLEIYGYLDMGLQAFLTSGEGSLDGFFPTTASTFVFGNVNIYFDANPHPDWRGLVEIRFTNLPHGVERSFGGLGGTYERTDTTVRDITSPDGRQEQVLGSLIFERAWIEWKKLEFFKVRAGLWLTPYGIWNVDHGTPVQIALNQPQFIVDQAFPQRQLGVQLLGDIPAGRWNLFYSAYISNGRMASQFDFSADKALGGRLRAQYVDTWTGAFGVSGYWGTFQDITKDIVRLEPFLVQPTTTVEMEEGGVGADVAIDVGGFRLRTEGLLRRQQFEPGKHAPVSLGPPGSVTPNSWYSSGYLILAYQLPWWGLEPWAMHNITHRPSVNGDTQMVTSLGLNIYFNTSVQLKMAANFAHFYDLVEPDTLPENLNFASLAARLVLIF